MPVKIQAKKKNDRVQSQKVSQETVELQEPIDEHQSDEVTTDHTDQSPSVPQSQTPWNVDLWSFLAQMTQMMWQQNEMMKMMDERMKKLEEQNATKVVEGEVVKEPEVVNAVNEDNTASYSREDEEWYAEVVNKVWKILYVTAQAPVTRWMQDAAPMMEPVCERRRVWNMIVSDTKYFNTEDEAKAYIENLRKKGTMLPWAKIISCFI